MTDKFIPLFISGIEVNKNKKGYPNKISPLTPEIQKERLSEKINKLIDDIDNRNLILSNSTSNQDLRSVWVFTVVGNQPDLLKALNKIPDIDVASLNYDKIREPDEYFFDKNKKSNTIKCNLFAISLNDAAVMNFKRVWKEWGNNSQDNKFLDDNKVYKKYFNLFKFIDDIREWNYEDRIHESGFIESMKDYYQSTQNVRFEIEFWYSKDEIRRHSYENALKNQLDEIGGKIIGNSYHLAEINYHAVLVEVPSIELKKIIEEEKTGLTDNSSILLFRTVGQSAPSYTIEPSKNIFSDSEIQSIGDSENLKPPVIGLLDGLPLENHRLLQNRLDIEELDINIDNNYLENCRCHGSEMASLILHGIIGRSKSLSHKIALIPIMQPNDNELYEEIPKTLLTVDLFYRALQKLIKPNNGSKIHVINISQGIPDRNFTHIMSPLARLLDWFSYKYNVLFIVSAGNHRYFRSYLESVNSDTINDKSYLYLYRHLTETKDNCIFSPAESVNSITVGSLNHNDVMVGGIDPLIDESLQYRIILPSWAPNIISSSGYGYKGGIKPDIVYPGGNIPLKYYIYNTKVDIEDSIYDDEKYGIPAAYPAEDFQKGNILGKAFDSGTSLSTALITHEAGLCYEQLMELLSTVSNPEKYNEYIPVLLKGLLVHCASWNGIDGQIKQLLEEYDDDYKESPNKSKKDNVKDITTKWFGYGIPDTTKILQCDENKVILIACDSISDGKRKQYLIDIPEILRGYEKNEVTITLAYLSPTNIGKDNDNYAKLVFDFMDSNTKDVRNRKGCDYNRVRKGTVMHEIFESSFNRVDSDKISVEVSCTNKGDEYEKIKYSLILTIKLGVPITNKGNLTITQFVDKGTLYEQIKSKVRVSERIRI